MMDYKKLLINIIELFFERTFSFFEIAGLLTVTHISLASNSLWWMLLYVPVILISAVIQEYYRVNK